MYVEKHRLFNRFFLFGSVTVHIAVYHYVQIFLSVRSVFSLYTNESRRRTMGPSIYLSEMKTALLKVAQGAELTEFFCMSDRPFKELVLGQGLTLQ